MSLGNGLSLLTDRALSLLRIISSKTSRYNAVGRGAPVGSSAAKLLSKDEARRNRSEYRQAAGAVAQAMAV
jgi:hypothetical protein